jgi:hypothetical protein
VIELRLAARHPKLDGCILCDVLFPGNAVGLLLQLEKGCRAKLGDPDENAACRSKPEIRAHDRRDITRPGYAALDDLAVDAEGAQLIGAEGFEARRGDREGRELVGLCRRFHCNNNNVMRNRIRSIAILSGLALGTAACSSTTATSTVSFDDFGSFNGARVEVVAEGGIAALSQIDRIDHDSRGFVHVMRHLCATNCGAPMDSAQGIISAAAADSIFNILLSRKILYKEDYGSTRGAADMMEYTVRITSGGTTKTIKGDDGSIPDSLREVISAIRGAVSAARK